jgi:hypothetical protein
MVPGSTPTLATYDHLGTLWLPPIRHGTMPLSTTARCCSEPSKDLSCVKSTIQAWLSVAHAGQTWLDISAENSVQDEATPPKPPTDALKMMSPRGKMMLKTSSSSDPGFLDLEFLSEQHELEDTAYSGDAFNKVTEHRCRHRPPQPESGLGFHRHLRLPNSLPRPSADLLQRTTTAMPGPESPTSSNYVVKPRSTRQCRSRRNSCQSRPIGAKAYTSRAKKRQNKLECVSDKPRGENASAGLLPPSRL